VNPNLDRDALAHLEVIYRVTIHLRLLGWEGSNNQKPSLLSFSNRSRTLNPDFVADLMDAIHNTPSQISKPYCPTQEYVEMYYRDFDRKHPKTISLETIFTGFVCDTAI